MMKKEKEYPLISVIVPTFERSELLPRALDSIVAQTWTNTEIIVVDDNIPDSIWQKKTREVLVPFLKNNISLYRSHLCIYCNIIICKMRLVTPAFFIY